MGSSNDSFDKLFRENNAPKGFLIIFLSAAKEKGICHKWVANKLITRILKKNTTKTINEEKSNQLQCVYLRSKWKEGFFPCNIDRFIRRAFNINNEIIKERWISKHKNQGSQQPCKQSIWNVWCIWLNASMFLSLEGSGLSLVSILMHYIYVF